MICAAHAGAQPAPAQPPAEERAPAEAPPPFDPSPIIGVPVEPGPSQPVSPPAAGSDAAAASAAAVQPPAAVTPPQAAPRSPVVKRSTPAAVSGPMPPSHDAEHPPEVPDADSDAGLSARLSLGIGASLWIEQGGHLDVWKPPSVSLDLGYALDRRVALIVRGSTWLRSGDPSNEFLGLGGVYHFVNDRLYVSAVLGLSWARFGALSEWEHVRQGLALEIDVGQTFALSAHTDFAVGAHFQFGTPLLREQDTATLTSLHAGIFVALGLR